MSHQSTRLEFIRTEAAGAAWSAALCGLKEGGCSAPGEPAWDVLDDNKCAQAVMSVDTATMLAGGW